MSNNISIFENIKNKYNLNQSLNILKDIKNKKRTIKKLINNPNVIADNNYRSRNNRKPSILLEFEKGLEKTFFSINGIISQQLPFFKKCLVKNELKKNLKLKEKINAGKLTYYFIKENEEQLQSDKRTNNLRRKLIAVSNNYTIGIDKDNDLKKKKYKKIDQKKLYDNLFMNSLRKNSDNSKNKIFLNTLDSNQSNIEENNDENEFNNTYYKSIIRKKILIPKINLYSLNNNTNNTILNSNNNNKINISQTLNSMENTNQSSYFNNNILLNKTSRNRTLNKNNSDFYNAKSERKKSQKITTHNKAYAFVLQQKIKFLNKKQNDIEQNLINIIDNNEFLKPLPVDFKKDVEVISGVKPKKKRAKGTGKEYVSKIKKIEGEKYKNNLRKRNKLFINEIFSKTVENDDNHDLLNRAENIELRNKYVNSVEKIKKEEKMRDKIKNIKIRLRLKENMNFINKKFYNMKIYKKKLFEEIKNFNNN